MTRLLLQLLLAYLSCCGLSKAQIAGDDVKPADGSNKFSSQVLVEMKIVWRSKNPVSDNVENRIGFYNMQNIIHSLGSGTILSPNWILTAAHLFDDNSWKDKKAQIAGTPVELEGTRMVRVMAGQHDKTVQGNRHTVSHVIIHHGYNLIQPGHLNDIALMRLDRPIESGDVGRLALPPFEAEPGMKCRMSGWGIDNSGVRSNVLKWTETQVVEPLPSKDGWVERMNLEETDLFTVGMPPQNTGRNYKRSTGGRGDSGGGLECVYQGGKFVFGVMHGGKEGHQPASEYGTRGIPSLYTSVFKHKSWIDAEMKRQLRSDGGPTVFLKSEEPGTDGIRKFSDNLQRIAPEYGKYFQKSNAIIAVFVGGILALLNF